MADEQPTIYDNITDPLTNKVHSVKSKKGARILKNYMSIYQHGQDINKLIVPSASYGVLNILNQGGLFNRYETEKNIMNMNGDYSNEAYSHIVEHSKKLGHWVNSSSTYLKVLVLCAEMRSFRINKAVNWINRIHPKISEELITMNLPFEVTWLGPTITNGVMYEKNNIMDAEECDMEQMGGKCIKHILIKGSIPTHRDNRVIRERGGEIPRNIDVLKHNKYDIIIDENCVKLGNMGIVFESLIPHMYPDSWIVGTTDINNSPGSWAQKRNIIGLNGNIIKSQEVIKMAPPMPPTDLVEILKSIELCETELKRIGLYEFTKQKFLMNSHLDNVDHFIHSLILDQYPNDSVRDKIYKNEIILFNLRKSPYDFKRPVYIYTLIPEVF
jgi:hypothetical protein